VTIESLLWSFVVVFMIHEFEEIIMLKPWLQRHRSELRARFPKVAARVLPQLERLSISSLSLAIMEEFIVLCIVVAIAAQFALYDLWAGVLIGYLAHAVGHLVQVAIFRRYCPFLWTSLLSVTYGAAALSILWWQDLITPVATAVWTVIAVVLIGVNIGLAYRLAEAFERWLGRSYPPLIAREHD